MEQILIERCSYNIIWDESNISFFFPFSFCVGQFTAVATYNKKIKASIQKELRQVLVLILR